MIFWLRRCPQCGSVFREHRCDGKDELLHGRGGTVGIPATMVTTTYTQLAMFEGESDEG